MKKALPKRIAVFLSLDQDIFKGYYNPQDPAPLYKRQLSHDFEEYIMLSIRAAKRDSPFHYKISYRNECEKQYAEPLLYAIRRHFADKKAMLIAAFERFKRRTYMLLFSSLVIVMICQGLLPVILDGKISIHSGLTNGIDVFSWVILWRPIDKLIFQWNPYLKDISIMERLEKAEVTITEIED